ncbi:MAG: 50S ribosomal protein L18e [Nanoarchaeota archaeon]
MKDGISKTKLKRRLGIKNNPQLKEALKSAMKNQNWVHVAKMISLSRRKRPSINLSEIENQTRAGDIVIFPGKILSKGDISKKVRICALGISSEARNKLKKTKSDFATITEEIKKNPKAEGIKIIK